MQAKFSEDVVPLADLKINPVKVVNRAQDRHRHIGAPTCRKAERHRSAL